MLSCGQSSTINGVNMNIDQIRKIVFQAVNETINPDGDIGLEKHLQDENVVLTDLVQSSLAIVRLCLEIELELGIAIETADLTDNPTIASFSTFLAEKTSRK